MFAERRALIVGASAAGVSAALSMRDAGFEGTITVLERSRHDPYERPPLSKEVVSDGSVPLRPIVPADTMRDRDIDLRLGVEAARIDPSSRSVVLHDAARISADRVVLATGVRARRLAVPGAEFCGVHPLRDADDAAAIAAGLRSGGPLLVVGGGFIGLELAAVARSSGIEVDVVEASPLPLAARVGTEVATRLVQLHLDSGVRFHVNDTVVRFDGSSGRVESAVLASGKRVAAATVVVGIGTLPNDELAKSAGAHVRDGVVVDEFGRSSLGWLLAAGDVAVRSSPWTPEPSRIEHWDSSQRHGAAVGATAAGKPTTEEAVPYVWSDQYGLTLQMFGRDRPGDRMVTLRPAARERFVTVWLRQDRIVSVAGVGSSREVRAGKTLIELGARVTADELSASGAELHQIVKCVKKGLLPTADAR